jgi:pimeloyl-ACP methyl ester carboxylesterase
MGSSYGGYLAAMAACTRGHEISAAVVHAGISDIASCRHTAKSAPFWDALVGGPPHEASARSLYVERSPVYVAKGPGAPTLVLTAKKTPASRSARHTSCSGPYEILVPTPSWSSTPARATAWPSRSTSPTTGRGCSAGSRCTGTRADALSQPQRTQSTAGKRVSPTR